MGTREQELLAQLNLEPLWLPFTANRQFKASPRLLVAAKDMYYTAHDGRRTGSQACGR
jgi:beta-alanine--pyruvate transaminase